VKIKYCYQTERYVKYLSQIRSGMKIKYCYQTEEGMSNIHHRLDQERRLNTAIKQRKVYQIYITD
jgi:hypothetical protein